MPGFINWRAKQMRKKSKASRTPGKTKGERCMLEGDKKFYMSNPRARRKKDYARWHELAKEMNK